MIDALYISASGLRSEQKQLDVISNNVANLQTPGFKRSRVNFVDVASAAIAAGQAAEGAPVRGDGTRIASVAAEFSAGDLRATGNALDLAIDGTGFFELATDDGGVAYTRDGRFHLDAEGNLVSLQGLRLAGAPQVPAGATGLRVDAGGEISALLAGDTERTTLGHIELATFVAPDALAALGDNRYGATDGAGAPAYATPGADGTGHLAQGYIEGSNVEMIDEMSSLVLAQRAYQLNARVLQAADQVLETINNLRR
jgi:flagellar basal-body rod protein FlgG